MLKKDGYPFKAKAFAHNYAIFQRKGTESKTYQAMLKSAKFGIPPILKYMFEDKKTLPFKISEMCCYRLKKEPSHKWALDNNKKINITGMSDSMVEMGKVATANTLGYVKAGLEAFKDAKIPIFNQNGECVGIKHPYRTSEEMRQLVDFMVIFLDEAIKDIDNQIKKDEAK